MDVSRRSAALTGVALIAAGALVPTSATPADAAPAAPGSCDVTCVDSSSGGGWAAGATSITITTTGGGATTGSSTRVVAGPPPACRMVPGNRVEDQGREFGRGDEAVDWEADGYSSDSMHFPLGHEENLLKEGRYWVPSCRNATPEQSNAFFGQNNILFVEDGTPAPAPPPPSVQQLLEVAEENLDVPAPDVGLNPAAQGYVNLATWVWAEGGSYEEVRVRAQAGRNWAEIAAVPDGLTVRSVGGRQEGSCASGGVPWSAGATTDCAIVFERSSAAWDVDVSTLWQASYTNSESGAGELGAESATTTVAVPVREVQTLVGRAAD